MKTFFLVLMAVCLLTFAGATKAIAGDQDFVLVNATGVEINNLYVSPSNEDKWGDDILGEDTLADGANVTIKFAHDEKECGWDFMVKDKEDNGVQWTDIDLCKYSEITLHKDGEKVWATFK